MLIFESRSEFIDEILHGIAADRQITAPQHAKAEGRYCAVGDVLGADGSILSPFDPRISPQGSLLLGTTLRPDDKREYDLDLLCCLSIDHRSVQRPSQLLELTESVLRSHGTYETMLERKRFSRCVRIRYRDEFHLDIVPCCPDGVDGAVWLPDRNVEEWRPANPKAFANWFEDRASIAMLEAVRKAAIEPLPGYEPADRKPPLKRVVQLFKRWRDVAFRNESTTPTSILLTALAALHYGGESSVYDALARVLAGIIASLPAFGRLHVLNPIDPREDLSECWNDDHSAYSTFVTRIRELEATWRGLGEIRGQEHISDLLSSLFETPTPRLMLKAQAAAVNQLKQSSKLGIRPTGRLTTATSAGAILDRPGRHFGA